MTVREPVIKTRNLKVVYDRGTPAETVALNEASIEIFPEEYVIFFGPSGCGKSSLLYALAGIETSFTGEATIAGHNLHEMSSDDMAMYHRTTIGMVFQSFNLVQTLNVIDNIALPQAFQGASKDERYRKARELLGRFELKHIEKRLPTELSGGQQQRVAIARALINDPPIVFADEPTGNLDSKSAAIVMKLFDELSRRDKKTLVMVTHNPNYLSVADRVFHMKDARVLWVEDMKARKEEKEKEEVIGKVVAKPKQRELRHKTAEEKLDEYILMARDNGYPDEMIVEKLLSTGWGEEKIKEEIEKLKKQ